MLRWRIIIFAATWLTYAGFYFTRNNYSIAQPDFMKELEAKVDKSAPVLFICRSGGRSHNAAMMAMQAGYAEAYNVLEGFEGDKDAAGHRGSKGGWRFAGLPWVQS